MCSPRFFGRSLELRAPRSQASQLRVRPVQAGAAVGRSPSLGGSGRGFATGQKCDGRAIRIRLGAGQAISGFSASALDLTATTAAGRRRVAGELLAPHDDVEAAVVRSREVEQLEGGVGEVEHDAVRLDETLDRRPSGRHRGERLDELRAQVRVEPAQHRDVRMELDAVSAEVELEDAHAQLTLIRCTRGSSSGSEAPPATIPLTEATAPSINRLMVPNADAIEVGGPGIVEDLFDGVEHRPSCRDHLVGGRLEMLEAFSGRIRRLVVAGRHLVTPFAPRFVVRRRPSTGFFGSSPANTTLSLPCRSVASVIVRRRSESGRSSARR